jgi:hypothetical protein
MAPAARASALAALLLALYARSAAAQAACADPRTVAGAASGCPCTPAPNAPTGRCDLGYVCAEQWTSSVRLLPDGGAAAVAAAPPINPLPSGSLAVEPPPSGAPFVCQACAYGQFCPPGSALPAADSALLQMALARLACPPGAFCPTPREARPCPAGAFCAAATVRPVTCDVPALVARAPALLMPARPTTVYESVYVRGTTLGGNACPANSTTPTRPCEGGYYCPSPSEVVLCPAGSYCKPGAAAPARCPPMTACPAGSAKAALSWTGFVLLAGVLAALWVAWLFATTAIRVQQRRLGRSQAARERLGKLLTPLFAPRAAGERAGFAAFASVRPRITIEFSGLGLTLRDGTTILRGVSGRFSHSRVAAVMGPSGAGKSTLLNVIMGGAGAHGKVAGRIRFNGRDLPPVALCPVIGFVPQEDIVHEDLTGEILLP